MSDKAGCSIRDLQWKAMEELNDLTHGPIQHGTDGIPVVDQGCLSAWMKHCRKIARLVEQIETTESYLAEHKAP